MTRVAPWLIGALLWPAAAAAQVRWDAGGEAGVLARFTSHRPAGVPAPLPGPAGAIYADVALLPMVRLGAYLAQDVSPAPDRPARQITEAGARAKLSPPLLPVPWRLWIFAGAGYARAYEPSHPSADAGPLVPGMGGGFLDIPLGAALAYRIGRVWEPFVELGARVGVGFTGSLYQAPECGCASGYVGRDSVALSLSLGLNSNE